MSASGHDGVAVIKPGQTYVGKQGFTYGAGASAETVGARKICMNDQVFLTKGPFYFLK